MGAFLDRERSRKTIFSIFDELIEKIYEEIEEAKKRIEKAEKEIDILLEKEGLIEKVRELRSKAPEKATLKLKIITIEKKNGKKQVSYQEYYG